MGSATELEWDEAKSELRDRFGEFAGKFEQLTKNEPNWEITNIDINDLNGTSIIAEYSEGAQPHEVVKMIARQTNGNATASLSLTGSNHWKFSEAEKVVSNVSDTLTTLLEESELKPEGDGQMGSGRGSRWTIFWNIRPKNHPKYRK